MPRAGKSAKFAKIPNEMTLDLCDGSEGPSQEDRGLGLIATTSKLP